MGQSNRGIAYVLALAIYAGTKDKDVVDVEEISDRIYSTLNRSEVFTYDEAKADLYAQLAEKLKADTPFKEAVEIIEAAVYQTYIALRRG